jgi:OmpA-OmpF porin, OOP family
MNLRHAAALALGLSLVGFGSQAQTMTSSAGTYGPYLRLEGGWNNAIGTSFIGSTSSLAASASWKNGYIVGGAAGYGFGPFRAELNFDYRNNGINNINVGSAGAIHPFPAGTGSGSLEAETVMANALMDLPYSWLGITPYVGVGGGIANVNYSGIAAGSTNVVNDNSVVPAIQAMAGVRYNLTDNWQLELEYRFLNGFHPTLNDVTGQRLSTSDYRNNSILISVTYAFGVPPAPPPAPAVTPAAAPPPPPPAAAGPRQLFIVFFDFDKSTLTAAGRQVLDEAAAAFNANNTVRIQVTGYTDTVGTQGYNLALSERRADAVRDYLAGKGVPAERQNVAWKGKTDLRVQTPDGVREPQNRRAEIIFP